MHFVFDADNDGKWITIHPGNSSKGVHIKIDKDGEIVGGNPHLIKALKDGEGGGGSGGEGGIGDDLGTFQPPSIEDFDDDFFEYPPIPQEGEFGELLLDDDDDKGEPKARPPLEFSKKMAKISISDATKKLNNTFHKCYDTAYDLVEEEFSHHGKWATKKILDKYLKGSKKSREEAYKATAITIDYLKHILKDDAIEYSSLSFVPCKTKNSLSSYMHTRKHSFWGEHSVVNIATPSDGYIKFSLVERDEAKNNPDYLIWNVESRYPIEDMAYIIICHELAHHSFASHKLYDEWEAVLSEARDKGFKPREEVSKYAYSYEKKFTHKERVNECHSECFAMMCHPDYKWGTLPKIIEDYFKKHFFA